MTKFAELPRAQKEERAALRRKQREKERAQLERDTSPITWLPEPVTAGGFRIVGVASDASDDVKREYL